MALFDFFDLFAVPVFFLVPVWLIAWGVYALRRWSGRWRYVTLFPAAVILFEASLLYYAGG
jgi:hypothetical protein